MDALIAVLDSTLRLSAPLLLACLAGLYSERSGVFDIGLEGKMLGAAFAAGATAAVTGSPWLGVLAAALSGAVFGLAHGVMCALPRVNDIAIGIALMLLGTGLAFFFGKPYVQPVAPDLPSIPFGWWSDIAQVRAALDVNALFLIGLALALGMAWMFRATRAGLIVRVVGDGAEAARALGVDPLRVRALSTAAGGALAGVGGAYLSLYYPGSWNEGISSGQGLMAVALVIFARWRPVNCFWAALLFGGAGALGPALQSVGVTGGYHLFNAAPYVLTLGLLIAASSPSRALAGAPAALGFNR